MTCVKWVPGSENTFISSHRSGNLYVWTTEHSTKTTGQLNYVSHKEIHDATICTVKPKNKFPVLFRWSIGHGAINNFAFSPDLIHIAIASQDGFLRVYNFEKQEIYGRMRSYYGALLCVCWSPDGRYTVTGGEDDLVNVWSFEHRRVVARGDGHKSYISAVAFDPYTTILPDHGFSASSRFSICSSEDGFPPPALHSQSKSTLDSTSSPHLGRLRSESSTRERCTAAYRLGSVGQDTQLCLWDLSGDSLRLRRPFSRSRSRLSRQTSRPQSIADLQQSPSLDGRLEHGRGKSKDEKGMPREEQKDSSEKPTPHSLTSDPETSISKSVISNHVSTSQNSSGKSGMDFSDTKESALSDTSEQSSEKGNGKKERKPKKEKGEKKVRLMKDPVRKVMRFVGGIGSGTHLYRREVGTFETCNSDDIAPKMDEVNHIEPLLAKKISHERLTALVFREDCIVTACQEGFIHTWSRPDTVLPAEADKPQSRPTASSVSSNHPGVSYLHYNYSGTSTIGSLYKCCWVPTYTVIDLYNTCTTIPKPKKG